MCNIPIEDVLSEEDMDWAQPQYSKREVNEAGAHLLRFMLDYSGSPKEISHTMVCT